MLCRSELLANDYDDIINNNTKYNQIFIEYSNGNDQEKKNKRKTFRFVEKQKSVWSNVSFSSIDDGGERAQYAHLTNVLMR